MLPPPFVFLEAVDMTVKPNIGPHAGNANNRFDFADAFSRISEAPDAVYATTGNGTEFTAQARLSRRGGRKGEPVIVFYSNGIARARVYACCWGMRTNCSKTHIDTYTCAL
jgi:hypothetical protein